MIDYAAARAVAAVARTGSFEAAARELSVTPSAISQRVKHLEERLGAVLIERGTPCTATEKGDWLCRHIDHVAMLEKELTAQLPGLREGPADRVTLAIAANSDSLDTWFLEAVSPFTRSNDVLLNIVIDDQDHTAEWLKRGRVLAAVTSLKKPVAGCHVRGLGSIRYHATASPDFMARHFADGVTLAALAKAPGLTFSQKDRLQTNWIKQNFGEAVVYPTHFLPSTQSFVTACLLGIGWGLNPAALVEEHLTSGRLVEMIPGAVFDLPLFWQVNRLADTRLSGLTRAVVEAGKKVLG